MRFMSSMKARTSGSSFPAELMNVLAEKFMVYSIMRFIATRKRIMAIVQPAKTPFPWQYQEEGQESENDFLHTAEK